MKIERFNENLLERPATYEIVRDDNGRHVADSNSDIQKAVKIIDLCKRRGINVSILKKTTEIITEDQLRMEYNTNKFNI